VRARLVQAKFAGLSCSDSEEANSCSMKMRRLLM
jgi:hypothetical protein